MSGASTRTVPADVELEAGDEVTIHAIYEDPVQSEAWGVLPGTALCGFIFTTENDLGPTADLPTAPGVSIEACVECERVTEAHRLEAWLDGLI